MQKVEFQVNLPVRWDEKEYSRIKGNKEVPVTHHMLMLGGFCIGSYEVFEGMKNVAVRFLDGDRYYPHKVGDVDDAREFLVKRARAYFG